MGSYTVHPSFYELQRLTFGASDELFADSANESGVVEAYLSADGEDMLVGSSGVWSPATDLAITSGAAGNPPYSAVFLRDIFQTFDGNLRQNTRCFLFVSSAFFLCLLARNTSLATAVPSHPTGLVSVSTHVALALQRTIWSRVKASADSHDQSPRHLT